MPRWSHSSMKWAPLSADSLNRTPLLATMPDRMPVQPGEAGDEGRAVLLLELVELAGVDEAGDHLAHVVGGLHVGGHGSVQVVDGGERLAAFDDVPGRRMPGPAGLRRCRGRSERACASFSARWSVTPETRECRSPPPSSSAVTISPIAAFTSGGPPRKIVPWFRTMTVSSLIAGT